MGLGHMDPDRYTAVRFNGKNVLVGVAEAVGDPFGPQGSTSVWVESGQSLTFLADYEFHFARGKVLSLEVGDGVE